MASWFPFVLLPVYFAGLAGAMVWLAPRTAAAPETAATLGDDAAPAASAPAPHAEAPTAPKHVSAPIARRERPRHATK